ncbi:hypothetical protein Dsin_024963 [Dipteronia sinensis]|uniref:Uncharacterized protein n=1 Tax=Dipteronia sinensis TaxID=43782 RepID=A0AAE0DWN5_9ROSI|nr:hypothetical protein Dsin_024963 [Dipteronia sinensis]
MAVRIGSLREKLLSVKDGSELGLTSIDSGDVERGSYCSYRSISDKVTSFVRNLHDVVADAIQMGKSDPRKIIRYL